MAKFLDQTGVTYLIGLIKTAIGNKKASVTDNNPSLSWGSKSKVATIDGTDINVTMPSNPNTDTSVTSAANHYAPEENAGSQKNASGATGTAEATVQVVTGIKMDAKGHVTGVVSGAATDTNTKVTSAANHYSPTKDSSATKNASGATGTGGATVQVITGIETDGKGHVTGIISGAATDTRDVTKITVGTTDYTPSSGTVTLPAYPTTLPANGGTAENVSGTVAVDHGGTGATTAAAARTNLGLGTAATAATASEVGDNANLPTGAAVIAYVSGQMTSALKYKGTIGTGGTVESLPASHKVGDVYVVKTAGTYAGEACEVGDYIICNTNGTTANNGHWDVINGENQVNNEGATLEWGTSKKIATVDGTDITVTLPANPNTDTSVTASSNHYSPSTVSGQDKSASASGATAAWSIDVVKGVTLNTDGKGHVTGISVTSGKIPANPNTDTMVTSAANHYTPQTSDASGATFTPSGGTATSNVDVITSIKTDGKGHITAITSGKAKDTTYSAATPSSGGTGGTAGLMSAADKEKLDGIAAGATANAGTITGITMNGASKGTSGVVDLGTVITSHQTVKQDGITGATANRYAECSTGASTAAKTASVGNGTPTLEKGLHVFVKFANANTAASPTLNINSTGAKSISVDGTVLGASSNANELGLLSGVCEFVYDGTSYWHLVNKTSVALTTTEIQDLWDAA